MYMYILLVLFILSECGANFMGKAGGKIWSYPEKVMISFKEVCRDKSSKYRSYQIVVQLSSIVEEQHTSIMNNS